jgi:hypothetical protein
LEKQKRDRRTKMKTNLTILLTLVGFVAAVLLLGCSHTYVLNKESPNEFVELINKKTKNKKAVIQARDGKKYDAEQILLFKDSTSWIDPTIHSYKERSNSELNQIILNNHGKGALEGLGVGLLSGFASGYVFGYATYSEHGNFLDRPSTATITGIALGSLGGFLGLIGGAAAGAKEIFMFNERGLKAEYYVLKNVKILSETESSIQIEWQNKAVWLDRAEITIKQTDGEIDIRIPDKIYKEKFGN